MHSHAERGNDHLLGLSPRTVNKHLEHVYVKLGVETRKAATSVAMAAMSPVNDRSHALRGNAAQDAPRLLLKS
ncbi:LuxR C-terminal-related transcriptional regulator [Pseudomonas yamanorum]|uniref:LuxR C-terminal-related transcriptional regulator n=1 Tax=Pseudomonas yamanorum TaxID=515393 RepID=UPI003F74D412